MHDLRQPRCPSSTPMHCKKRVATAWGSSFARPTFNFLPCDCLAFTSARGAPAEAKRAYRDSVRLPLALMAQADTQGISLRAQSSFGALGKLGDLLYRRSRLGMRTQFFLFSLGVFTADPLLNFFRHEALLF